MLHRSSRATEEGAAVGETHRDARATVSGSAALLADPMIREKLASSRYFPIFQLLRRSTHHPDDLTRQRRSAQPDQDAQI